MIMSHVKDRLRKWWLFQKEAEARLHEIETGEKPNTDEASKEKRDSGSMKRSVEDSSGVVSEKNINVALVIKILHTHNQWSCMKKACKGKPICCNF